MLQVAVGEGEKWWLFVFFCSQNYIGFVVYSYLGGSSYCVFFFPNDATWGLCWYTLFFNANGRGSKKSQESPKVLMMLIISGKEKVSKTSRFISVTVGFQKEIVYPAGLLRGFVTVLVRDAEFPLSRFEVQSLFQSYKMPLFTGDVLLSTPTTIEDSNSEGSESPKYSFWRCTFFEFRN